jgi:hypothetical protein
VGRAVFRSIRDSLLVAHVYSVDAHIENKIKSHSPRVWVIDETDSDTY